MPRSPAARFVESEARSIPSPVSRAEFRFAAKQVFLTYSQVCEHVTKESVYFTMTERFTLERYTLGEESHEDGGRHVHACLVFPIKVNSRDSRFFDINCGMCTHDHHPNIQKIQRGKINLLRVEEYCAKEDPNPLTNVEPVKTWGEIISESSTQEEYLSLVQKHYPRDFCLSLDRLKASAKHLFPDAGSNTITDFAWPANEEEPESWNAINENVQTWDPQQKSLVLIGPPGCGKTSWAKKNSPKPTLFIRHLDSLVHLKPHHKSIIFDDLEFSHLPPATQKFLTDCTDLAEIHIRYRIGQIPPRMTRIFTANEYPFTEDGVHGEAIRRRVEKISLY